MIGFVGGKFMEFRYSPFGLVEPKKTIKKNFIMSTTYIAAIISFLSFGLPFLGIDIVNKESFASTIQELIGIGATLWIFYGRYRAGGITAFGLRKKIN